MKSLEIENLYNVRKDFIVIGLTGRTGAGCSNVSEVLEKSFDTNDFPKSLDRKKQKRAEDIKYEIVYDFLKENYKPFTIIRYKEVITFFMFREGFEKIMSFIKSKSEFAEFEDSFNKIKNTINDMYSEISKIDIEKKTIDNLKALNELFFGDKFNNASRELHDLLTQKSKYNRILLLQMISNNMRRKGEPFNLSEEQDLKSIYLIAKFINILIKSCREKSRNNDNTCRIVIDSLRNSLEMNFFKQRYSAFYMVAVSRKDIVREGKIKKHFGDIANKIIEIDDEEHKGSPGEFYKQDVSNCIQKSDIHLYNIKEDEAELERSAYENIISFKHQIVTYLSLIMQPGIVTPSPHERCMQMAFTAKYNSGCVSRQVGSVITDDRFSIKAIGWNNTPEGQIPCLFRTVKDVIDDSRVFNKELYSEYEKKDHKFKETIKAFYEKPLNDKNVQDNLKGRHVPYCFKSIINSYQEGKNQIHTRSLHAEENAFLQITKYGGMGIKGGFLFVTASPCELCSKKSFQLGIKTIFYIDPYPGIAKEHIISCGDEENIPKMIHFFGAIGNAYHWLYEPFMAYKDELNLILGIEIKNENQTLKNVNASFEKKLKDLGMSDTEIENLKNYHE